MTLLNRSKNNRNLTVLCMNFVEFANNFLYTKLQKDKNSNDSHLQTTEINETFVYLILIMERNRTKSS